MLQRTTLETHDRDEAIEALTVMAGGNRPTVGGRGGLSLRASVTRGDVLVDAATEIGTPYRVESAPADALQIMTSTAAFMMDVDGTQHVAAPGDSIRVPSLIVCELAIPRGAFSSIAVRGTAVREIARSAFVEEPTTLDPAAVRPISPAMQRLWAGTIGVYRRHVLQPGMYDNLLIREEATRSMIATAIIAFGLHRPAERTATSSIAARRARAFIDDNLQRAITIHDIAKAARLSVRGLQYAFQQAYGESPMAFLRSARLSAAHQELLGADPARTTVAEIAHRWGFAHLGRFAAAYKDAYGETPRATIPR
ncbi:AraC family transcriptional regulator [Microbacterium sp. 1.5R]|uniref:helix-turn-helix transcriptional regulator n=1 Tax=Microbacterium sp. 1.5R TaxID=1916917 RepID=UPI00119CAFF3|nr:helix-turn-helix domain-containing protein [Microbacterium sp. 1.5R]